MDVRETLMKLGEQVGDKELLKACKKIHKNNPNSGYISKFATMGDDCDKPEGSCGTCRNGVWYPCT